MNALYRTARHNADEVDGSTYSGQGIVYRYPAHTRVEWIDLRQHLARVPRFGGALDWPVLRHLALCVALAKAQGIARPLLGYIAAHDFAEYILGDVPKALKEALPVYRMLERRWERHIYEELGLPMPSAAVKRLVKYFDTRALVIEMTRLGDPRSDHAAKLYGAPLPSELDAFKVVCEATETGAWRHVQREVMEAAELMADGPAHLVGAVIAAEDHLEVELFEHDRCLNQVAATGEADILVNDVGCLDEQHLRDDIESELGLPEGSAVAIRRVNRLLSVRAEGTWYRLDGVCAGEIVVAALFPGGVTELCWYATNPPTRLSATKEL